MGKFMQEHFAYVLRQWESLIGWAHAQNDPSLCAVYVDIFDT